MRFILSNSLKPYPRRLYRQAIKTGRPIAGRKYRIDIEVGRRYYIAVNDETGRASEWFLIVNGYGPVIIEE